MSLAFSSSTSFKRLSLFFERLSLSTSILFLSASSGKLPTYILDSKRLAGSVKTPHMSEDIEYRNGEIFIGFEAGAKKYGAGLLPFSERNVRKYSPDN